jgi:glutaredoxin
MKPDLQRRLLALAALLLAAPLALAQFKVVGPDGKVTYTDRRPESAASGAKPLAVGGGAAAPDPALPYELRQAATRYPVTLYTTARCAPCDAARNWLRTRGVPHAEKTISSNAENEALAHATGSNELPAMTIGPQVVRGFGAERWSALFDAAGYPAASQLPRNYRYAAATPLIAPPAPAEPPPPAPPELPSAPPEPGPANPAGIRF